jgi:hypothetical protein
MRSRAKDALFFKRRYPKWTTPDPNEGRRFWTRAMSRDAAAGSSYYTQPVATLTKGNMTRAVRVIET